MILLITVSLILCSAAFAKGPSLAYRISQQQVSLWKCQTALEWPHTRASVEPWALPRSQSYRKWVLRVWTQRNALCKAALHEQARQWNWQAWLPDKWQRIGACETGYGQRPGNWRHNSGAYQGAFGFATSSWDAFKLPGYPDEAYDATPWQQYMVALAIYNRYGLSGWGCRNA